MGIRTRSALEILDLLILGLDILVLLLNLSLQVLDLLAGFVELSGLVIQVLLFLGKSILDFLHLCIGESNLLIGNLEIILAVKDGLKVEEFFFMLEICVLFLNISLSEAATFSRNVLEGSSAVAPGNGGKPKLEQKALVKRLERLV